MTTKQNAIDLANTARSEAANTEKRTIAAIITNWNECVKQAGFTGVFDFPTTGYTRKAQLIADLERCAAQLDDYVEPLPELATMTVEQQTREFNAALTRVLDVEEAHAEAQEINTAMDAAAERWSRPGAKSNEHLRQSIADAHAEALQWNAFIDYCWPLEVEDVLVGIEISAHEDNRRFDWLANRWGLFWGGCDFATRQTMVEEAQAEAIAFNREHTAALIALSCNGFRSRWSTHSPHHEAMSVIYCHEQALQMDNAPDNNSIAQFKKVAPAIVDNVKARITGSESDETLMKIIHEEIAHHFVGWQNFFTQYVNFTEVQRREFSGIMYDLVAPISQRFKGAANPLYESFVKATGKTGALNFITHQPSVGGLA